MFQKIIQSYRNAFGGLTPSTWWLSVVLLINRAGTMVIPFLAVYMTKQLHFTTGETGIVLALFGMGAVLGAYFGGRLTDKIGFYKIQFGSLILTGLAFIILGELKTFYPVATAIFLSSMVSESFRPANATAIAYYSKPENRTRAYALNRLAVNLGWGIGPAMGGLLSEISFKFLFWVDGLTCIAAAIMMLFVLPFAKAKKELPKEEISITKNKSAYRDGIFLWFSFFVMLYAICFFQINSTVPVYFTNIVKMTNRTFGFMIALNGILIALFEMVLVYYLEGKKPNLILIAYGAFLTGFSFVLLNVLGIHQWVGFVLIVVMTLGEMLSMPFMNAFWISRSSEQNRGQYAALYVISYSAAQVSAPLMGTYFLQHFGHVALWNIIGTISVFSAFGFYFLYKKKF